MAQKKSFEERLKKLEEIAEELKEGDIPLEKATEYYKEGIKLAKELEEELGQVEKKIEIVLNDPSKPETGPERKKAELELFDLE
ncbi:exodeoxyribonuclease VII small subunit [Spirochaetia bacterium 38H-sp]|uniref:Exodeoxyribonuclease 7 small subunit n=1 Tax=Rarispira pelagica TaxID=3141764 RepID=A0ABU9UAY1_9SPIR